MKIEKGNYQFIVSISVDDVIVVMIVDKEKQKIVDVSTLELVMYNEIEQTVDFDVKSLFDKAATIFEETKASIDIITEIHKARQENSNKDNKE